MLRATDDVDSLPVGMPRDCYGNTSIRGRVVGDFRPGLSFVNGLEKFGVIERALCWFRSSTSYVSAGRENRICDRGCEDDIGRVKGRRKIAATSFVIDVQHVGP